MAIRHRREGGALELKPFDLPDAATVAGWSGSADESLMWCSRAEVTAEVVAGWSAEDGVVAYAMVDGGQLVAYGELWVDPDESEVELARLIVAPERRGRGDGRALVRALAGEAVRRYPAVFMRVHPDNARALRCYAGAGFTPVSAAEADEWNRAQPVAFVWLRLAAA